MWSFIAYSSLIIAVGSFIFALKGNYKFYWLSAVAIYFFSFLAGFSIGQLTVALTFIPLALAIGKTFDWIKNRSQFALFFALGTVLGISLVMFVDDYFLFYPLIPFFS